MANVQSTILDLSQLGNGGMKGVAPLNNAANNLAVPNKNTGNLTGLTPYNTASKTLPLVNSSFSTASTKTPLIPLQPTSPTPSGTGTNTNPNDLNSALSAASKVTGIPLSTSSTGNTTVNSAPTGTTPNDPSTYSAAAKLGGTSSANASGLQNTGVVNPNAYSTSTNTGTDTGLVGSNSGIYNQAAGGLLNIGQNSSQAVQDAQAALLKKQNEIASINGVDKGFGTGEQQVLSNQLPGYQTAVQNALTEQGQQTTALNNAASQTAPVAGASFFGSPSTGGLVGANNSATGGTTGNALIDGNVQQALQLVQNNGTDVNDPQIQKLLSISPLAQQAFNAQMLAKNPNYNPTAQSSVVQQNLSQSAQYQQKAADLSVGLNRLDTVGNQVVKGMGTVGFNPASTPIANSTFKNYYTNVNPSAAASIQAGLSEIKNSVSSVIAGATGLTPTAVSDTVDSYDFEDLNPSQLNNFLLNVKQLGQSNLQAYQTGQNSSLGSGSTPYTGAPANPQGFNSGSTNGTATAVGATAADAGEGLLKDILNQAGGAISGAAGGLAAKFFGAI